MACQIFTVCEASRGAGQGAGKGVCSRACVAGHLGVVPGPACRLQLPPATATAAASWSLPRVCLGRGGR